MNRPTVYIARPIPEVATELLASTAEIRQHTGSMPPTREELLSLVRGCSGILSLLSDRIDAEVCEAAGPKLKVVSNFAVGYNNIDVTELRRREIAIGNTPDVLTDATADVAVSLLLSAARMAGKALEDAKRGHWQTWEPMGWLGLELGIPSEPKTLGIVGMGRIGQAVAERMQGGWGMNVLYHSRTPKPSVESKMRAEHVSLDRLLAESDFVSLHTPLNDDTKHLINSTAFSAMKKTCVLVNTARGDIVDQDALVDALRDGQIFAAGLDVCTPEPLPVDHPLFTLTNCVLLPHIGSATFRARAAMAERAAKNILAGLQSAPLPYPVS
ncbi:MAG: 2-hydroxyacid dehydrogenase [Pirellulaceae bacterium]